VLANEDAAALPVPRKLAVAEPELANAVAAAEPVPAKPVDCTPVPPLANELVAAEPVDVKRSSPLAATANGDAALLPVAVTGDGPPPASGAESLSESQLVEYVAMSPSLSASS